MKTRLLVAALLVVLLLTACDKKVSTDIIISESESNSATDAISNKAGVLERYREDICADKDYYVSDKNGMATEAKKTVGVIFSEEAEKLAKDILDKERLVFYSEEHEYEMDVDIYDKTIIQTQAGELYYFRVSTMPLGEGDNAYIIKDSECGAEVLLSFASWSRNRYNVYDGGYLQNCGSGGAVCMIESLYYLGDNELIYTYKTDVLIDYLICSYNKDFGVSCSLAEALEKADLTENNCLNYLVVEIFSVGDKWVWKLDFPDINDDEYKSIVLEIIKSSDISDSITICSDDESFSNLCKEMLQDRGIDLSTIYQNELIIGQRESLFFKN